MEVVDGEALEMPLVTRRPVARFTSYVTHVSLGVLFVLLLLVGWFRYINLASCYNDAVLEELEGTTELYTGPGKYNPQGVKIPKSFQYAYTIDRNVKQMMHSKEGVFLVPNFSSTFDRQSFFSLDVMQSTHTILVPDLPTETQKESLAPLIEANYEVLMDRSLHSSVSKDPQTTRTHSLPQIHRGDSVDWNTVRELRFEPFDYNRRKGKPVEVDYSLLEDMLPNWSEKKKTWKLFEVSKEEQAKQNEFINSFGHNLYYQYFIEDYEEFGWRRFYFAINLFNNEDYVPYLTGALVHFFQNELEPLMSTLAKQREDAADQQTHQQTDLKNAVIFSIYMNHDQQNTALLVERFLIPHLKLLPLFADEADNHNRIFLTSKGSCYKHTKKKNLERIEWLSCVRNKAMEPLYEDGMTLFGPSAVREDPTGEDLVVLFMNDVFFRPKDIISLLNSKTEESMTQKDFLSQWSRVSPKRPPHVTRKPHPLHNPSAVNKPLKGFDMACGMDFYSMFYDTWVARDLTGRFILETPPYTMNRDSQQALKNILFGHNYEVIDNQKKKKTKKRRKSFFRYFFNAPNSHYDVKHSKQLYQSLPVKCCWNGAAAVRGSFFLPVAVNHTIEKEEGDVVLHYRERHFGRNNTLDWEDLFRFHKEEKADNVVNRMLHHRHVYPSTAAEETSLRSIVKDLIEHYNVSVDDINEVNKLIKDGKLLDSDRKGTLFLRKPSGSLYKLVRERTKGNILEQKNPSPYETSILAVYLTSFLQRYQHALQKWISFHESSRIYNNYKENESTQVSLEYYAEVNADANEYYRQLSEVWLNPSTSPRPEFSGWLVNGSPPVYLFEPIAVGLRFRFQFLPSYKEVYDQHYWNEKENSAAALFRRVTDSPPMSVFDKAASTSECTLFCKDLLQRALLTEGRVARVLMNPNILLTYTAEDESKIHYTRHPNSPKGLYYYFCAFTESEFVFDLWIVYYNLKKSLGLMGYMDDAMGVSGENRVEEERVVYSPYHPLPQKQQKDGQYYYEYNINTETYARFADGFYLRAFLDVDFLLFDVLIRFCYTLPITVIGVYYIWSDISYHIKLKLGVTNRRRRRYGLFLPFGTMPYPVHAAHHTSSHEDRRTFRNAFRTLLPQERLWYTVVIQRIEPFLFYLLRLPSWVKLRVGRYRKKLTERRRLRRRSSDEQIV